MTSILLPEDYFSKLDPSYQKCILKLEKKLNQTYDSALKSELIDDFSEKYLMPKEIWDKRIDLQSLNVCDDSKAEYKKIKEKALSQFYSKRKHPRYYCDPNRKLLKVKFVPALDPLYDDLRINELGICLDDDENIEDKMDQKYIEYCLTFPHWKLEECLKDFEQILNNPIPRNVIKKCEKAKKLYDKIKLSENNLDEWVQCLLESGDEEFIVHNIEYRLGGDLTNKALWKLYLRYLEDSQKFRDMVIVYQKYCRFFLDDVEVREQYESKINEIEKADDKMDKDLDDPLNNVCDKSYNLQACQQSLHQNIFPQNFSLPKTIIRYILDHVNPNILHYLYQSCKYFFHIHPKLLCHKLIIRQKNVAEKIDFKGQSFDITVADFQPEMFKNFYVTNSLHFYPTSGNNLYFLSNLIKILYRCDAKYFEIYGQQLSVKELRFLIGHGNVKYLGLYNVKITNPDGTFISLEDILSLTPKIYHIGMLRSLVNITAETVEIISKIKFESNFELFTISIVSGELEPYKFCEFLKKNVKKDGGIWIKFQNPNPIYFSFFVKILKECAFENLIID